MTEFVRIKKELERINDVLMKSPLNESNWQHPMGVSQMETLLLSTIAVAMKDEDDYIQYWVYEADMGRVKNINKMITKNDVAVKFKTLEDLYNILTTN